MTRLRSGAVLWAALLLAFLPALAGAVSNSMLSNLANPSIGFNALMLAQVSPDLPGPGGLQFQESEISLVSVVDPLWTLWANLVFAPDEVTPEEVYAVSNEIPSVQLKMGRFKADFGKHGLLHRHAWPFVQSPLILSNSIGEEGFGGMGLEAAWMTPLPWYAEITLGAYESHPAAADQPMDFGASTQGNIPVLAHWKNLWDLGESTTMEIGASGLEGLGADGRRHAALGGDFTLRWIPMRNSNQRGAIVQAEYIEKGSDDSGGYTRETYGGYSSLQLRWAQNWWTGLRAEEAFNASTEVLTDPTSGDLLPTGQLQRASANIAWVPSEFSAIRLEGSIAKTDNELGLPVMDRRLMLQTNFTIGYHPAHAY